MQTINQKTPLKKTVKAAAQKRKRSTTAKKRSTSKKRTAKKEEKLTPTQMQYSAFDKIYRTFNEKLFNNEIADAMLVFARMNRKGVCGYFRADSWKSKDETLAHEIALTPSYIARYANDDRLLYDVFPSKLRIFTTIAHEMCHLWQHDFEKREKVKSTRRNYHDHLWALKMMQIGLFPCNYGDTAARYICDEKFESYEKAKQFINMLSTRASDSWKIAGSQQMTHFVITPRMLEILKETCNEKLNVRKSSLRNQYFAVDEITSNFWDVSQELALELPFLANEHFEQKQIKPLVLDPTDIDDVKNIDDDDDDKVDKTSKSGSRVKFVCEKCSAKAWGKDSLRLHCDGTEEDRHELTRMQIA